MSLESSSSFVPIANIDQPLYFLFSSLLFKRSFSVGDDDDYEDDDDVDVDGDGVCSVVLLMITIIALVVTEQTPPERPIYSRHGHSH